MCFVRSYPLETRKTSIYSAPPEVSVPGTRTSSPSRSDHWRLGPSRSNRYGLLVQADLTVIERLGPIGTSGQRPKVNPYMRGHAQTLLFGLPIIDQNFWLETGSVF